MRWRLHGEMQRAMKKVIRPVNGREGESKINTIRRRRKGAKKGCERLEAGQRRHRVSEKGCLHT